jgi:hypothetical protein
MLSGSVMGALSTALWRGPPSATATGRVGRHGHGDGDSDGRE